MTVKKIEKLPSIRLDFANVRSALTPLTAAFTSPLQLITYNYNFPKGIDPSDAPSWPKNSGRSQCCRL